MASTLELYYGKIRIGEITDSFSTDETWYGRFAGLSTQNESPIYVRIMNFIDFCRDWNVRVKRDTANPPDASEFDKFADLVSTDNWSVKSPSGSGYKLVEAPNFFENGEITWRQIVK
jgi:hypothetical protein